MDYLTFFPFVILLSAILTGFLAGLLGLGGGILTVPLILYWLEKEFGAINYSQQIAVGTSFAIIFFTVISSTLTHHHKGYISWTIVKKMAGYLALGTFLGACLSLYLPSFYLKLVFIFFLYTLALTQLFRLIRPAQPRLQTLSSSKVGLVGFLIGLVASWLGIGGGSMLVPFLLNYQNDIRIAIGTSSALSLPISAIGAIMYLAPGLTSHPTLPPHTLGFIYLPAFICLSLATAVFSPLGARVSHHTSPYWLKGFFILLLISIASKLLWSLA
ncbi:MAG: sulfite exporter TauE/SafE family protein [Neisseriaceae bacterium]